MTKLLAKLLAMLSLKPVTIDFIQDVLAALTDLINEVEAKEVAKAERSAELADMHLERSLEHRQEAARATKLAKTLSKAS